MLIAPNIALVLASTFVRAMGEHRQAWPGDCLELAQPALKPDLHLSFPSPSPPPGSAVLWVYSTLLMQQRVPNDYLGRISALEGAAYTISESISSVFGGAPLLREVAQRSGGGAQVLVASPPRLLFALPMRRGVVRCAAPVPAPPAAHPDLHGGRDGCGVEPVRLDCQPRQRAARQQGWVPAGAAER